MQWKLNKRGLTLALSFIAAVGCGSVAQAEIDGHGPDAWRVVGVSANDSLNARMGPGTNYPVIDRFAHNERLMQQVTCVPFYTASHYMQMSQAQIDALPARWCLMRNKEMTKAGWVAQRFITPEEGAEMAPTPASAATGDITDDLVAQAQDLVREVYERESLSEGTDLPSATDPSVANNYFTSDIVALLEAGEIGAHPLHGAQDFEGSIGDPTPDPDQPMFRGMITINVDFTNFGQPQRAIFYVRPDTTKPGSPLRIFRIDHDGWSIP